MKSKRFGVLLALIATSVLWTPSICAASAIDNQTSNAASGSAQQATHDLRGTWTGTFLSKYQNVRLFTISVALSPDSKGVLFGSASLESDCIKNPRLHVSLTGSKVVLAGSDPDGDSITIRGTLDKTGTLLTMDYIANGSASGRCETDIGTGTMQKR